MINLKSYLGLVLCSFALVACDSADSQPSGDVEGQPSAGQTLAAELADEAGEHCPLALHGCLDQSFRCLQDGDAEGCVEDYEACVDDSVLEVCELAEDSELTLHASLDCWSAFASCAAGGGEGQACSAALSRCVVNDGPCVELDDSGCEAQSCDARTCEGYGPGEHGPHFRRRSDWRTGSRGRHSDHRRAGPGEHGPHFRGGPTLPRSADWQRGGWRR